MNCSSSGRATAFPELIKQTSSGKVICRRALAETCASKTNKIDPARRLCKCSADVHNTTRQAAESEVNLPWKFCHFSGVTMFSGRSSLTEEKEEKFLFFCKSCKFSRITRTSTSLPEHNGAAKRHIDEKFSEKLSDNLRNASRQQSEEKKMKNQMFLPLFLIRIQNVLSFFLSFHFIVSLMSFSSSPVRRLLIP